MTSTLVRVELEVHVWLISGAMAEAAAAGAIEAAAGAALRDV